MEAVGGPGPCNYSPKTGNESGGHQFGNSSRSTSYDNKLPGPGSYEVKPAPYSVSFSMVPRRLSLSVDPTPGPGSYAAVNKSSVPNYSLSKSPRKPMIDDNHIPGPGSYTISPQRSQQKTS